jgi:leucyl aminopeptidase (aminopeptidase T)
MMFPINQINTIKFLVSTSLAIKPGENVLFIADTDENVEIAAIMAAEAKSIGAEVAITVIDSRKDFNHEPPKFVAESMKHADVVIGVIYTLMHTKARKAAQSAGARFASLGGVGKEYLSNLDFGVEDLNLIERRANRLAEMVTQAKTAEITSDEGSQLTMSLLNRKGIAMIPICREPGTYCYLPDYSEVPCPPVEGTAEGILVIDGAILGSPQLDRVVQEPITLKIEEGKITRMSGGKDADDLKRILANADSNGKVVAELGIGTSHKVKRLRGVRKDDAMLGTVHIGLGKNNHIGGELDSAVHIDLMVKKPTLELDGFVIIEKGEFGIE